MKLRVMAMMLALLALAGCSQAAADQELDEDFAKVSDSAQFVPSEKAANTAESELEPVSDEVSDEDEYVSEYWDSDDYSGLEYAEDHGYADYDYTPDYSAYNTDGPSHTMPGYYDDHVETWYEASSHYLAGNWTVDDEGFYHDENGRYVIGVGIDDMDSMPYGTVVMTGRGEAAVYDYGTATNVHDFAVTGW